MKKITFVFSALLISTLSFAQTAEEVVANYIKAVGGTEAIGKVKDITLNMTGDVQGQNLEISYQKKPADKFVQTVTIAGMGEVAKTICNGTKVQITGMQGSQDITDADKVKAVAIQALIVPEASYAAMGAKLNYVGKEKLNNVDVHKVEVVLGDTKMTEFYDVTTGYKVQQIVNAETPMGKQTIISDYADYKEVSGVKIPHKLTQDMGMIKFDLTVTKAEVNTNLADALFEIK